MIDVLQYFQYPFTYGWLAILLIYVVVFRFLRHWDLSERLALITGSSMIWFSAIHLSEKNPFGDVGRASSLVGLILGGYLIYRRLQARDMVDV